MKTLYEVLIKQNLKKNPDIDFLSDGAIDKIKEVLNKNHMLEPSALKMRKYNINEIWLEEMVDEDTADIITCILYRGKDIKKSSKYINGMILSFYNDKLEYNENQKETFEYAKKIADIFGFYEYDEKNKIFKK